MAQCYSVGMPRYTISQRYDDSQGSDVQAAPVAETANTLRELRSKYRRFGGGDVRRAADGAKLVCIPMNGSPAEFAFWLTEDGRCLDLDWSQ